MIALQRAAHLAQRMSNEPDKRILALIRRVETAALLLVGGIAAVVLALWFAIGAAGPGPNSWSSMTANTAFGVLACAVGLALMGRPSAPYRWAGRIAAGIMAALALLTLAEYLLPVSFGFDTWLPHGVSALHPGRPAPQTAVALALMGVSVLLACEAKGPMAILADLLTLVQVAFLLAMFGGHLYDALDLIGVDANNFMAPHSLLSLSILTFVVVGRRAKQGHLLAVLVNIGIGSRVVRTILPLAVLMPFFFFGAEAVLSRSGTVTAHVSRAIAAAAASFLILCLTTWMGWRINTLERDLRDLSLTDELTTVYNRRGFYFFGQQAIRDSRQAEARIALFFFDLDGLKRANDMYGHEAGSALIQSFARILRLTFRKSDIVGRVGGDEFAVLTQHDSGVSVDDLLKRLNRRTAEFNATNTLSPLSFSVGVVATDGSTSESLEELITRGDALMYRDKANKKSRRIEYA